MKLINSYRFCDSWQRLLYQQCNLAAQNNLRGFFVDARGPGYLDLLKNSADLDFVVDYEAVIVKLYLSGGLRNGKFKP